MSCQPCSASEPREVRAAPPEAARVAADPSTAHAGNQAASSPSPAPSKSASKRCSRARASSSKRRGETHASSTNSGNARSSPEICQRARAIQASGAGIRHHDSILWTASTAACQSPARSHSAAQWDCGSSRQYGNSAACARQACPKRRQPRIGGRISELPLRSRSNLLFDSLARLLHLCRRERRRVEVRQRVAQR